MRSVKPIRATPRRSKASRRRRAAADLADTAIVVVTGTDTDGDAIARPANWDSLGRSAALDLHGTGTARPAGAGSW